MSLISVVIPAYNEEENLSALYDRLCAVAEKTSDVFEFIFVDDCSTDKTFEILRATCEKDARVRVIRFSKNFGSHAASLAGLVHSKGAACTFMAADLQDPPEFILEMLQAWKQGAEVIIGIREWDNDREKRIFPWIYYSLVRKFALPTMPRAGTDVILIDRKVVDVLVEMKEKNTSLSGLILWSGFKQKVLTYKKGTRAHGTSKWTLGKKIKLFIDTFVSFSYMPIRTVSVAGLTFAFLGFLYALFIICNKIFYGKALEGWSSLMVVLLIVSGIQLIMLGILGEYLWRNFDESRKRPSSIISDKIGFD